ncbi:MAG: response regulator transcription factor [Chlorobiaceae bacterium]|nr:response regulator transcription factor [Chlorobiaceae bacterium]NTV60504.1 response regulator transcription factor [Chlorobiaceae bacterium]
MAENGRVIVVEDDSDFCDSMVEYLKLSGLEAVGVESALEFYKNISGQHYDIVVLDIGLPDQNGIVLAEYIRNNTRMRIIMLTAQSSLESKINAYRAGADLYLVKPVDFSELSASIFSILGRLGNDQQQEKEVVKKTESSETRETKWTLLRSGQSLFAPEGEEISLTAKEYDLIECLARTPGDVVVRQGLLDALDYENNEYGNRALDALVHRLRMKNRNLGCRIPMKTSHGTGYCFSAPIIIK